MNYEILNLLTTILLGIITIILVPLFRYVITIEIRLTKLETINNLNFKKQTI
ncbi:hypothetical protein AHALO_1702 [Malaciobacter halophilus]|nr:hypothetical protein AHALO_1366 [Malaciobacter halophilus]AXH10068.1 hypothetical protein AHALO_1702 [Malaciobacter halophilus]